MERSLTGGRAESMPAERAQQTVERVVQVLGVMPRKEGILLHILVCPLSGSCFGRHLTINRTIPCSG